MAEARGLRLYTIPPHRAFADALVAGLMRRYGDDPLRLARGLVLLPNNRARGAVVAAFVRASGGALLLPRLVSIGSDDLGEAVGAALDPADAQPPVPPAMAPLHRRLILARLVQDARAGLDAGEAIRLAGDLARTLDQLIVEEVAPAALADLPLAAELTEHWQAALDVLRVVIDGWPAELAQRRRIDPSRRRALLLDRLAARWKDAPPAGFVCAAGITDSAPAVARMLRCVAELPDGMVVFAGLGTGLSDEEWNLIGPHASDPATGIARRSIEVHPQFHLNVLLGRIGAGRGEVRAWQGGSDLDAPAARGRAIASALAPAALTARWNDLDADQRRLTGVTAAEFATPADEAQGIALAMREALETPGRTVALVTPDRALARRVAAHCARWGIAVDDSAGRPLAILPPGTLLRAILDAAAQDFAPVALLTLLKHPLVRAGPERGAWLEMVRRLDRTLRGPRPAPGLAGIAALWDGEAPDWWRALADALAPVTKLAGADGEPPDRRIAGLRDAATALAGDAAWSGPAGRAAGDLLAALEADAHDGPAAAGVESLAAMIDRLMEEIAVRPPQGGHPRVAIYGLIEARLQSADLMILGGLNEGVWPASPAPDPWLAPRIRAALGLPGLERAIGVAAHDFGQGLGAPQALITRSRRDARAPALASRFWLRLEALAGDRFTRAHALEAWVRAIDDGGPPVPASRPAPVPPRALRPIDISVTQVDRLKADPYAFYAQRILGFRLLDPVDADPSAAWRGTAVHSVLEEWARAHDCRIDALRPLAEAMLNGPETHPLLRALWAPRLLAAIDWIAARLDAQRAEGREVWQVEGKGGATIADVALSGRFDRIDRLPGGGFAVVDYKTGKAPSPAAVVAGYSMQLGLLGAIAESGGFPGIAGTAGAFEYWSLAKDRDGFGKVTSPVDPAGKGGKLFTGDFVAAARRSFAEAAQAWLTGDEPFTAKLHPEYAPYAEYDQLMRRDEWYGRER